MDNADPLKQTYYDITGAAYGQNVDNVVTGPAGTLAKKTITGYNPMVPEKVAVNFLFQIVASAKAATRVDLTGVASKITDSMTAQSLIALFQTNRLPNLHQLVLANNNLGDLMQIIYTIGGSTVFTVTPEQNITSLDLSNNNIPTIPWGKAFPMGPKLLDLNLSGNTINVITEPLKDLLKTVIEQNGGHGDVDGLTTADQDSITWLLTLVNVTNGSIGLNDSLVNLIMQEFPAQISSAAVERYYGQMNKGTAEKILETIKAGTSVIPDGDPAAKYLDIAINGPEAAFGPQSLQLSGGLSFAIQMASLPKPASDPQAAAPASVAYPASDPFTIKVALWPGSRLSAQMDAWRGPTAFNASLAFAETGGASALTLTPGQAWQAFYTNNSADRQNEDFRYGQPDGHPVNLTIDPASVPLIKAGASYSTTVHWTIGTSINSTSK